MRFKAENWTENRFHADTNIADFAGVSIIQGWLKGWLLLIVPVEFA